METKSAGAIAKEKVAPTRAAAGRIDVSQSVVAILAGLAAREVPGLYALGRSRVWNSSKSPTRGVTAEVGQREAAIDLEAVIEHGCDIRAVARDLRQRIAEAVRRGAAREVVEVNIDVIDIHLPERERERARPTPARRVE